MSARLGDELAIRPLHFIWLADGSGSMNSFYCYRHIIKREHTHREGESTMNSTNKKAPGARATPLPFNRQAGHMPQLKSAAGQLKSGLSAQSVKQPVALPVYRPQSKPQLVQQKTAGSPQKGTLAAPPVFRPQFLSKALQPKMAASHQSVKQPRQTPTAPPVYRPQLAAKFIQPKIASGQRPHVGHVHRSTASVIQPAWGSGGSKSGLEAFGSKQPPPPQVVKPVITFSWQINQSAKTHYGDGWGAAYKITNDTSLKDMISSTWQDGENDDGADIEILLGDFTVKGKLKGCNIYYKKEWNSNNCNICVWHCGPSNSAG